MTPYVKKMLEAATYAFSHDYLFSKFLKILRDFQKFLKFLTISKNRENDNLGKSEHFQKLSVIEEAYPQWNAFNVQLKKEVFFMDVPLKFF